LSRCTAQAHPLSPFLQIITFHHSGIASGTDSLTRMGERREIEPEWQLTLRRKLKEAEKSGTLLLMQEGLKTLPPQIEAWATPSTPCGSGATA